MRIVSVGHALVDYFVFGQEEMTARLGFHLGSFNHLPRDKMIEVIEGMPPLQPMAGGSAANVVKLASQLGMDTTFVGKCGIDALGKVFKDELSSAGVRCVLEEGATPTGLNIIFLTGGRRTVATARSAAGEITPSSVPSALLKKTDLLLLEGFLLFNREVLYHLLRLAQEAKIKIAFDPGNLILIDDFREEILVMVENFVDYLFLNEEEALSLTGLDLEESLVFLNSKCECVALKRGEKGSIVVYQGKKHNIASVGPAVMDATGAGDGYTAGFLYGLANLKSPEAWGKAGALVAGEVIRVLGSKIDGAQLHRLSTTLKDLF